MNNRVYYGEYSLMHWINLMLNGNIVLPDYQRSFVWQVHDMIRLLKSLKEKQFVQPITIALHKSSKNMNLIIDGQQRLTTILLASLGYIPDLKIIDKDELLATGDDSSSEDEENPSETSSPRSLLRVPIKWTYQKLLDNDITKNTIETIKKSMESNMAYLEFNELRELHLSNDFFDKTFLGFSYIIPESDNPNEIQKYYTQLFRNINYFGSHLSIIESRRSLYYMNADYQYYFEGKLEDGRDVLCNLRIMENMQLTRIDFVRYLSILSQFMILGENNIDRLLKNYSSYSSRESYYSDYVSYILGLEQEACSDKFNGFNFASVFPNDDWKQRFVELNVFINDLIPSLKLNEKRAFISWIDADYWLFGIIYQIVFKKKTIILNDDDYKTEIHNEIEKKHKDADYTKSPNMLKFIRERILKSIKIAEKYVH